MTRTTLEILTKPAEEVNENLNQTLAGSTEVHPKLISNLGSGTLPAPAGETPLRHMPQPSPLGAREAFQPRAIAQPWQRLQITG